MKLIRTGKYLNVEQLKELKNVVDIDNMRRRMIELEYRIGRIGLIEYAEGYVLSCVFDKLQVFVTYFNIDNPDRLPVGVSTTGEIVLMDGGYIK